MTENYTQTVEVDLKKESRRKQITAFVLILISLALFAVAAVVNWFIVIASVIIGAAGVLYLHLFNETAKEYVYDLSATRLVVSKKDAVNRTRRILTLILEDVVFLGIMQDIPDKDDVCAVNDLGGKGVYQASYKEGSTVRNLYFEPDDYMIALLNDRLPEIN